jgi:CHAT domain
LIKLRPKSKTTIQYNIIVEDSPLQSPILPPNAFNNNIIDFIKRCPLDLIQLNTSLDYFEVSLKVIRNSPLDINIINIKDFDMFFGEVQKIKQVQLYFFNSNDKNQVNAYNKLIGLKSELIYSYIYNSSSTESNQYKTIISPNDFILNLINDQNSIFSVLEIDKFELNPKTLIDYRSLVPFPYFSPSRGNYFILNNLIGNCGINSLEFSSENNKDLSARESEKAYAQKHTFNRQNLFIDQINNIDFFKKICYSENLIIPVNDNDSKLAPLILVLPFHNPDIKKIYGGDPRIDTILVEQTENYINEVEKKESIEVEMYNAGMQILQMKLKYLDDIAFLHSSFSFSPIIRFPIRGKSIYRELSFFRTEAFPNLTVAKNWRNIKKSIYKFGKTLKNKIISEDLTKLIKTRDGQIVCVSDLPIEWLLIDDVPLSFTHDICRLPETTLHGLMSIFALNKTFDYSIPNNILEKTLVIMGSDEDEFKIWQDQVYKLSESKKFIIRRCNTIEEVKLAVSKVKPDLLIFDCHGDYDEDLRSSYLWIGDEKLFGDDVIKNRITAPIVFLSACGTAPTYGTINPIGNAFFETGTISVTSTYLPVSINAASTLYFRLLNMLGDAAINSLHKNWLSFISHIIRTSGMIEAYLMALNKDDNINEHDLVSSNTNDLIESMYFHNRRKLFKEMNNRISNLTSSKRLFFSEVIPEYLLYSNLGRGDLIYFDVWKDKYEDLNVSKHRV